jgi:hypothetical protein
MWPSSLLPINFGGNFSYLEKVLNPLFNFFFEVKRFFPVLDYRVVEFRRFLVLETFFVFRFNGNSRGG